MPRARRSWCWLLRGETLDSVSRDSQVLAHELESWKRAFLDAGMRGLKRHVEPEDRESEFDSRQAHHRTWSRYGTEFAHRLDESLLVSRSSKV